ncbi:MAG: alpha/beta fold hydrolase [Chloroflexi bacterium]|nr:alpha/beta fold hydrolase [Chloroflexota bacterium]
MPFADSRVGEIFYANHGARGIPVVFIHGAGSNHLIWGAQVRALGEMARAFALDLPAHGRSEGAGRASIAAYADDVLAFLDARALERAIIVGHSMGGAITQTLALDHADRIAGIALVATGARLRVAPQILDGILNDFDNTARLIARAQFANAESADMAKVEAQLRDCAPAVTHGDFIACNAFDAMPRVATIRAPALVVCGRDDALTPLKYSEYLAAQIPSAHLVVVENAGHAVMLEKPAEVNRALVEFVQRGAI